MRALFPYAQEALDNTHKIAERCNVEIEFGVTKLPQYDVPDGYTSWEYLQKLCGEGFHKRYPNDDGTLRERLRYELDVIHSMGYVDYFLIVWVLSILQNQTVSWSVRDVVRRRAVSSRIVWRSRTLTRSAIS